MIIKSFMMKKIKKEYILIKIYMNEYGENKKFY